MQGILDLYNLLCFLADFSCLHLMREVVRRSRDGGRENAYYRLYEKNFYKQYHLNYPSVGCADSVSLRLGHAPALTVHRTVIHYRRAASLPDKVSQDRFVADILLPPLKAEA